jgi:hypothetical protein
MERDWPRLYHLSSIKPILLIRKHGLPVILDADHSPSVLTGALERLFGSSLVCVFPLLIVVIQKQTQGGARRMFAKVQHGNVAVGIARGKRRSAADTDTFRRNPGRALLLQRIVNVVFRVGSSKIDQRLR